jgi:uncharacterized protein
MHRAPYALLLLVVTACSRTPEEPKSDPALASAARAPSKPKACPPDPDGAPPMLPVHTLTVREVGAQLACELVYKPADTERGLMYRAQMPEDHGMIFKLTTKVQRFWMHNTCIALDMLFLDDAGTVLGILHDVPPLNDESRSIERPSTYVVELNGGVAAKLGIESGHHFELPATIRELKAASD